MPQEDRYIPNDPKQLLTADFQACLIESLKSILATSPPDAPPNHAPHHFSGLYSGPAGTAYLFLQLSQLYPIHHSLNRLHNKTLLDWSHSYLRASLRVSSNRVPATDTSHCGITNNTLSNLAVSAAVTSSEKEATSLCHYADIICGPGGSDELLYGRAGYLYLLRIARSGFSPDSEIHGCLQAVVRRVVRRVLESKRPWVWHGKAYLGAAHGAIGILTQLVLSDPNVVQGEEVQDEVASLLGMQDGSGNFPSSLPKASHSLVQFCHGAPGFVMSLTTLRPCFPALQGRVDEAVEKARRCAWERGLLTKEPCLCHGVTGNALALDKKEQFEQFLAITAGEALNSRWEVDTEWEHYSSLFVGEAGRAWVWAMADRGEDIVLGIMTCDLLLLADRYARKNLSRRKRLYEGCGGATS